VSPRACRPLPAASPTLRTAALLGDAKSSLGGTKSFLGDACDEGVLDVDPHGSCVPAVASPAFPAPALAKKLLIDRWFAVASGGGFNLTRFPF
jgi:hypothetical protein